MTIRILEHQYSTQETGYFCGPGSTQIALTALGIDVPETQLADELGTDTDGTDWIGQITLALWRHSGRRYVTCEISNDPPTPAQREQLWVDVVGSIDAGAPLVANIVAVPGNRPPGYPPQEIYHYIALLGYDTEQRAVYVADPANFGGLQHYWLTVTKLASLIAPKGYSAAPGPAAAVDDSAIWADNLLQLLGPRPAQ